MLPTHIPPRLRYWLFGLLLLIVSAAQAADRPALWLAQKYPGGLDLQQYWVSEKYDGVRGYWDGTALWTRQGERIAPPAWFTAGWPATPVEGELWAGRGRFADAQSTARKVVPADAEWRRIRFMLFDAPATPGPFAARLSALAQFEKAANQPWVQAAPQWKETSEASLLKRMARVVKEGGEGLMLHKASAPYRSGRGDDVLKLKPQDDAEAQVIGHIPGKGKYAGQTGALLVRTTTGLEFRLGSGLKDADRLHPPATGTWVTYRYRGLHDSGLPRFASYWRVREDATPVAP
ncbi:DNA ligase [Comamonas testosteroni]